MANPNVRFDITANARTDMAFRKVRSQMQGMRRDTRLMGNSTLRNRRIIQQAGMQMSDFAVQVGGGQSAILAFTQNVPQFVQGFGAIGGVLAALITIFGTLTLVAVRTGTSLDQLTPITGVLTDEFTALAGILSTLGGYMADFINLVINNLDRIVITVVALTGAWAAMFALTLVKGAGLVAIFFGFFNVLTKIVMLLRFTPFLVMATAIAVAVNVMISLVKATGSWGDALEALRTLAGLVWDGIKDKALAMGKNLQAVWEDVKGAFAKALKWMANKWADFVTQFGGGVNRMSELMGGSGDIVDTMGVQAWASSFDAAVVRFTNSAGALRTEADALSKGAFKPLGDEVDRLREAMRLADEEGGKIDIRDWFGGGGGDAKSGGGAKKTIDEVTEAVKKAQEQMQSLADTMKDSFSSGIKAMVDGTKTFAEAIKDMAKSVIEKLFDILVVQQIVGSWDAKSGTGSGLVGMFMGAIAPSFDGGGFTGMGPRSGGIDGKGGFPAILHPNETVIDHAKGQSMGGTNITINMNVAANGDESVKRIMAQAAPSIASAVEAKMIDNRRRGGIARATYG